MSAWVALYEMANVGRNRPLELMFRKIRSFSANHALF